jgi:hypothetical protein
VLFTRKRAPLTGVNSWKDIKENVKNVIAEEILVRWVLFFIPNRVMHKTNRDEPFIFFNCKQTRWNLVNIAAEDEAKEKI